MKKRLIGTGLAMLLGLVCVTVAKPAVAEDPATCRHYCNLVLDSCTRGQNAGCSDKYMECMRGCPQ
jgi:hypothetical protein